MSLEECKRIAERRLRRAREHAKVKEASRYAGGIVEDGHVDIHFFAEHIGMSYQTWIVTVSSHKHHAKSRKAFQRQFQSRAEKYFEGLVQKYGLKEG